jgi:hypothetical protein
MTRIRWRDEPAAHGGDAGCPQLRLPSPLCRWNEQVSPFFKISSLDIKFYFNFFKLEITALEFTPFHSTQKSENLKNLR